MTWGRLLVLIAAATVLVRLAAMVLLQSWEFNREWAFGFEMGRMGYWLAEGEGFTLDGEAPTAHFPPVYPLVVGALFHIAGPYTPAAAVGLFLFQTACAAVTAVMLAVIGDRLFGRRAGLVAGFLWVILPASIFYSAVHIWYSELAVMLVVLAAALVVTAERVPRARRVALLGGLSGLIVLIDSTMGLYLALLLLAMLLTRRVGVARFVGSCLAWGFAAAIVVSPWMLRNARTLDSARLAKSNFGLVLFTGNNSFSSGTNDRSEIAQAFAALDQEELQYHRNQSEIVYYDYLRDKALEWIRTHPSHFLQLTGKRVWYFWVMIPNGLKSWLHLLYFGPLAILAAYGLWRSRRRIWELSPVWLFLVVYPLPYYITFLRHGRYTYPVEPFVLLLAAVPLAMGLERAFPALFRDRSLGGSAPDVS